ncbi:MAG: DUF805 domain-containing protein [Candidatus Pacebacteria bacterium CG_4_10_14_3_um_filter_34_15]|nr:DUF805 domain-containing protein [Candidatus Pacearchaeota archaeon]NCQ65448.1 DUF805 domain-containing protein [Candidatus Paceibacterota bacterium]PIQ81391.1 MAG: hypothetical protein COV78_00670 [Candidatus Pacebacteria bacterium CG11_big_fil_rev_8_21_14_0_20_34_55]PIX81235.1 MAG: DUF805 domain-containing protein [Candidatus Pacebacteria bacterium CG_4_10_14_3_um_filter_34_15]PJC43920.1 MAG: DUF805 domain-containing protein [Candidatus Pacebacteria bacterium CG_4_9_14_0_2_um_filter_34_50]
MEKYIENYKTVFKKYSVFSGRSNKAEYWNFFWSNLAISVALSLFSKIIGNDSNLLGMLYSLVIFLPSTALSIRRLHDIGKTGWMLLVSLIPVAGFIWLLILMATDGDTEENEYGPAIIEMTETK